MRRLGVLAAGLLAALAASAAFAGTAGAVKLYLTYDGGIPLEKGMLFEPEASEDWLVTSTLGQINCRPAPYGFGAEGFPSLYGPLLRNNEGSDKAEISGASGLIYEEENCSSTWGLGPEAEVLLYNNKAGAPLGQLTLTTKKVATFKGDTNGETYVYLSFNAVNDVCIYKVRSLKGTFTTGPEMTISFVDQKVARLGSSALCPKSAYLYYYFKPVSTTLGGESPYYNIEAAIH
jgi:hypothetical protein